MASSKTSSPSSGWRQGKWTPEEEQYVELLMEEFKLGTLPLGEGTTLRFFLSKMVNCNPKRISKKYENTKYNGKHKYEPSSMPMSLQERRMRRERLQEYERRFLEAVKRLEEDQELERESLSSKVAGRLPGKAKPASKVKRGSKNHQDTSKSPLHAIGSADPTRGGIQGRLAAELQTRMELANSQARAGHSGLRDFSLSNTANSTLGLPVTYPSPISAQGGKPQVSIDSSSNGNGSDLQNLMSLDYINSIKQANYLFSSDSDSNANAIIQGGQSNSNPSNPSQDSWQLQAQLQAANQSLMAERANSMMGKTANTFSSDQFNIFSAAGNNGDAMHGPGNTAGFGGFTANQAAGLCFPNLGVGNGGVATDSSFSADMGGTDQYAQMRLASLVARADQGSHGNSMAMMNAGFNQSVSNAYPNDLLSRNQSGLLIGAGNLGNMDNLKRDPDEVLEGTKPAKRFR